MLIAFSCKDLAKCSYEMSQNDSKVKKIRKKQKKKNKTKQKNFLSRIRTPDPLI